MNHPTMHLEREILRRERQRVYDRLYATPMDEATRERVIAALRPAMVVNIDERIMACAEYFVDSNILMLETIPREELVADLARALATVVDEFVYTKGHMTVQGVSSRRDDRLPPLGQLDHSSECSGRHEQTPGGRCLDADGRLL